MSDAKWFNRANEGETISDGFGSTWAKHCYCGGLNQIMRPGKIQCSKSGSPQHDNFLKSREALEAVLLPTGSEGGTTMGGAISPNKQQPGAAHPASEAREVTLANPRDPIGCNCDEYPECVHALYFSMGAKHANRLNAAATKQLATWMMSHSFATGHGDSFDDLLKELDWQVKELREKVSGATSAKENKNG